MVLVATGELYRRCAPQMIRSIRKFFLTGPSPNSLKVDIFMWADQPIDGCDVLTIVEPKGYPDETLFRYHTFLTKEAELRRYDYIFYADVDAVFVNYVTKEILGTDLTATTHPSFIGTPGTTEQRKESKAYLERARIYFAGGFVGGTSESFLRMCHVIKGMVDDDYTRHIRACWVDESHLNRYLYDNPPSVVLTP